MTIVENGYNATVEIKYDAVKTDLAEAYDAFVEDRSDEALANVIKATAVAQEMCESDCFSEMSNSMLIEQYRETLKMVKIRYLLDNLSTDEMAEC